MEQQIADLAVQQPFSRHGQDDWMRSLKLVARAQALLWSRTPLDERRKLLNEAEDELEAMKK